MTSPPMIKHTGYLIVGSAALPIINNYIKNVWSVWADISDDIIPPFCKSEVWVFVRVTFNKFVWQV